jgi:hypothetical protein
MWLWSCIIRLFATLGATEQQAVHEDAKERYLSYAFLRQSGTQHGNLKVDLQNDFTTGNNRYPKNRQQTLHLLDKYSKTLMPKMTQSEGTSFVQKGGRGKGNGAGRGNGAGKGNQKPFDKEYWKDKECYKCKKKGHPSLHRPNADDKEDDKSRSSQAKSVKKLARDLKSMKKAFTQLQQMKESDSDISDSDASEGESHFQFEDNGFQFMQVENEFKPQIAKLFKQMHGTKIRLNLREVILLDSQSTMDQICNPALVK